jgi:hypothetical protein
LFLILPAISFAYKIYLQKKKTDPGSGPSLGSCRQGVVDGMGHGIYSKAATNSCYRNWLQRGLSILYTYYLQYRCHPRKFFVSFCFNYKKRKRQEAAIKFADYLCMIFTTVSVNKDLREKYLY